MIRRKEERRIDGWSFRFCKSSVASRQWSVVSLESAGKKNGLSFIAPDFSLGILG